MFVDALENDKKVVYKYQITTISSSRFNNLKFDKEFYTKNVISKMNYLNFPDFNSSIRFELWTHPESENKKIRIYYNSLMLFEFN